MIVAPKLTMKVRVFLREKGKREKEGREWWEVINSTPFVPFNLQHFSFWSVLLNLYYLYFWVMVHHFLLISSIHFNSLLIHPHSSFSFFIYYHILKNYPLSLWCKSKTAEGVLLSFSLKETLFMFLLFCINSQIIKI